MNTTYTAGKDLILHDREIYLISETQDFKKNRYYLNEFGVFKNESFVFEDGIKYMKGEITHSTAQLDGVIKLDRHQFVKPVDVYDIATEYSTYEHAITAFISGYNANKGVYTREQLEAVFAEGMRFDYALCKDSNYDKKIGFRNHCLEQAIINSSPISVPKSLTMNDNNEIIEVKWN